MIKARHLAALSTLFVLSAAWAAPLDLDAGLRAAIYDDDYDLGVGGSLGVVTSAAPKWDLGLHLNYTHFASKTIREDADEFGAYVVAYFLPAIDQGFALRLGPHIGYSKIESHFLDLGLDAMVVFKVAAQTKFYATFVPSYLVGENGQQLFRIGFGVEYGVGGDGPAPSGN